MLNLENDYKILETKENKYDIHISLVPLKYETSCKYCNSLKIRKKGKKKQFYIDVPNRNKRTGLTIEIQKYFCKECKRTFQNNLPLIAENQRLTKRALKYIQEQSLNKPFTHLAEEVGMSEGNIRKIFKAYIENSESFGNR
jgi:transposase